MARLVDSLARSTTRAGRFLVGNDCCYAVLLGGFIPKQRRLLAVQSDSIFVASRVFSLPVGRDRLRTSIRSGTSHPASVRGPDSVGSRGILRSFLSRVSRQDLLLECDFPVGAIWRHVELVPSHARAPLLEPGDRWSFDIPSHLDPTTQCDLRHFSGQARYAFALASDYLYVSPVRGGLLTEFHRQLCCADVSTGAAGRSYEFARPGPKTRVYRVSRIAVKL